VPGLLSAFRSAWVVQNVRSLFWRLRMRRTRVLWDAFRGYVWPLQEGPCDGGGSGRTAWPVRPALMPDRQNRGSFIGGRSALSTSATSNPALAS